MTKIAPVGGERHPSSSQEGQAEDNLVHSTRKFKAWGGFIAELLSVRPFTSWEEQYFVSIVLNISFLCPDTPLGFLHWAHLSAKGGLCVLRRFRESNSHRLCPHETCRERIVSCGQVNCMEKTA